MFYAHISREYMPWGSSGQKSKCFCLGGHFDQKCPLRVRMKINLAYPATGCQKLINIVVELKVLYNYNLPLIYETVGSTPFWKFHLRWVRITRLGQRVEANTLGGEFKAMIILKCIDGVQYTYGQSFLGYLQTCFHTDAFRDMSSVLPKATTSRASPWSRVSWPTAGWLSRTEGSQGS